MTGESKYDLAWKKVANYYKFLFLYKLKKSFEFILLYSACSVKLQKEALKIYIYTYINHWKINVWHEFLLLSSVNLRALKTWILIWVYINKEIYNNWQTCFFLSQVVFALSHNDSVSFWTMSIKSKIPKIRE